MNCMYFVSVYVQVNVCVLYACPTVLAIHAVI